MRAERRICYSPRPQTSMSTVCLSLLISTLCFFCTTQAASEDTNGLVWKHTGKSVSILCRSRPPGPGLVFMSLLKGLRKEINVLFKMGDKNTVAEKYADRLQVKGDITSMEVVISNLTTEDTGPYWCDYKMTANFETKALNSNGSVLLVVTDEQCEPPDRTVLLVTAAVSAAVLFGVLIAFLLWIIPKIKQWHNKMGLRHVAGSEVYEDMRAARRA
ncbi:uncharacterized protein LOC133642719 [Entelurus aequoreus]|uniref:uncharacterized protein LOC133642719 n=1 Tax=Entelurus aequoreus TaxID=161455 RepID=UPI002B1D4934|nr:uncharacterized protein LOC133642719 [Entelurus aequoreus]XP_061893061.1 uncharacterized protein LOC133642719 [Entelurus aequoreus]